MSLSPPHPSHLHLHRFFFLFFLSFFFYRGSCRLLSLVHLWFNYSSALGAGTLGASLCCSYISAVVISLALIRRCSAAHSAARSAETRANGERQPGRSEQPPTKDAGSRSTGLLQVATAAAAAVTPPLLLLSGRSVCVLFVRDGSMPTGARLSSHTGSLCAYRLVIRRRALWDLLLIQQSCPGTGPHPVIRRCSAFLHSLTPALISATEGFSVIT